MAPSGGRLTSCAWPERFDVVNARRIVTTIGPDVVNVGDAAEVMPTDELPGRVVGWIVGRPNAA